MSAERDSNPAGSSGGSASANPRSRLREHGDSELADGLTDLAVNVRRKAPPAWLQDAILGSLRGVSKYPNPDDARDAIAAYHGVEPENVLVTNGATEAFTLIARAFSPASVGKTAIVHPQFSEPERASLAAGHRVVHAMCRVENGFKLDPTVIPDDAGLVFLGNPTNPTSVLHPAQLVLSLLRPGRVLVVDEAFMDMVPGETHSVVSSGLPGLLVVRSLTKMWAMPGIRVGYVVGDKELISAIAEQQPPWSVGTTALAAAEACMSADARHMAAHSALAWHSDTSLIASALGLIAAEYHGVSLGAVPTVPFLLLKVSYGEARRFQLRSKGWAIRGCASFPGLGVDWWRITVRDNDTTIRFLSDFKAILAPQSVYGEGVVT